MGDLASTSHHGIPGPSKVHGEIAPCSTTGSGSAHCSNGDAAGRHSGRLCGRDVHAGGMLVTNRATGGYKPDRAAREISHTAWSSIFTRNDWRFIPEELPFDKISNESVLEYEREHQPSEDWPPTDCFIGWSQGSNAFVTEIGRPGRAAMAGRTSRPSLLSSRE